MALLQEILSWLIISLISILIFIVPGWTLIEFFWPDPKKLRWPEKLGLSAGLSLAIYPILLLVTDLVGIHIGQWYAIGPVLLGVAGLVWNFKSIRLPSIKRSLSGWWISANRWPDLALVCLTLLVLIIRIVAIRGLEAPMWGNSFQHSVITSLLVENGGLFDNWEPYTPLQSFTYHFGFHSNAAALEWLTPLASPQAVLIAGQLINVLAVIALLPLAMRTGKGPWVGVLAVLVAGLLAPMPMAYTNWGRYTQLAGQAILPAAVVIGWVILDARKTHWRAMGLGWIAMGGLALTHYRVLIMASVFFIAYLVIFIWRPGWLRVLGRLVVLTFGAFIIFLPWLLNVINGPLADLFSSQISTPPTSQSAWHINNLLDLSTLGDYLPILIWILTFGAILLGLYWRMKRYLLIGLWWLLIVLAANPNWLFLPGVGVISNFAVVIAAYIPAAVLIGAAGGDLIAKTSTDPKTPAEKGPGPPTPNKKIEIGLFTVLILVGILGATQRLNDLDPENHALVTAADRTAMEWIRENLPEDARFHVNQFFAFSDSVTVGSDGGWWLPLLAERQTNLPPINYGFEIGPHDDFREWTIALHSLIVAEGITSSATRDEFQERGITHIYLGQRQGRVNHDGSQAIDPADLQGSPDFELVYQEDEVWIFRVVR